MELGVELELDNRQFSLLGRSKISKWAQEGGELFDKIIEKT